MTIKCLSGSTTMICLKDLVIQGTTEESLYTYTYTLNTLTKLKNYFCPSFPGNLTQKEYEHAQKKESTKKHCMFRATNLHQPRTFYTHDVGDMGDI